MNYWYALITTIKTLHRIDVFMSRSAPVHASKSDCWSKWKIEIKMVELAFSFFMQLISRFCHAVKHKVYKEKKWGATVETSKLVF